MVAVIWVPIARSFRYSVTDWNGATANWVGLDNFRTIMERDELHHPAEDQLHLLSVDPRDLVDQPGRLRAALRGDARLALLSLGLLHPHYPLDRHHRMSMRVMFSPRGAFNTMLKQVGLAQYRHNWLGETFTAFVVLIFIFYWQTLGQGVLIFLSGLAAVPSDLIEAARLDGANWWQRLTHILIPLLMPTIGFFFIFNAVYCFVGLFALVYTVTNGGPGFSTTPLDLLIYRKAFESGQLGYASALSVMLFTIVLVISIVQIKFFDRLSTD